ncbi:hypothetical protein M409DRAFT_66083 [Zasmidium cellare ATCC 36951]|uniref:Carotenoid oxygenase n=1 Tax=Zasmidium cellare ATCC 36951 TaxID=1080233 RepID=A0A6A6CKA2_ZASCE|nr:uncharacterized protein M409DRAFT_66083 [Zasmidium cellare ATCC 36951]KAF2167585.1 hypothetical protein M409DRAFT_66083 [Zasmidium cellare ATCC 36951]
MLSHRYTFIAHLVCLAEAAALANQAVHPRALTLGFYNTDEQRQPIELATEGVIPTWVEGSLWRGAGGVYDYGNYSVEHWFDQGSRMHRFEIANGKVSYRSRNSADEYSAFVEEHGAVPGPTFGGDPCKVIFNAFETTFRDGINPRGNTSAANVNVVPVLAFPGLAENTTQNNSPAKTLTWTTDGNQLQQLNPETLEPIELFTYQASNLALNDNASSAAHPTRDGNGFYNYAMISGEQTYYLVFHVDNTGFATILANITDAPPAYIHAVFGTQNYVVLIVWQAEIDLVKQEQTFNVVDALKPFNSSQSSLFYVIDKKKGGVVAKYSTDPFFAFHEVNAYEDPKDGSVVIDLPWYPNYDFLEAARVPTLRANVGIRNGTAAFDLAGTMKRYRLATPAKSNSSVFQNATVDFSIPFREGNMELPQINEQYRMKPYRYAYGVHVEKRGYFSDSIVKIDTQTQQSKTWTPRVDSLPSEPMFIARPNATSEDDGVLLTVVLNSVERRSSLVVIDAKTMNDIGRAEMPLVMNYGFHGAYKSA